MNATPIVSLKSAQQRYPHGTNARYVLGKCRCYECRIASAQYEYDRNAAIREERPWIPRRAARSRLFLVWNRNTKETRARYKYLSYAQRACDRLNAQEGIERDTAFISVSLVRQHVAWLQNNGVGVKTIARRAGISYSVLQRILGMPGSGREIKQTRRSTAEKILSVSRSEASDGVRVDKQATCELIDRMVKAGYRRWWIASEIMAKRVRSLQIDRGDWISIRNARKVHELYVRLQATDKRLPAIDPQFVVPQAECASERNRGRWPAA